MQEKITLKKVIYAVKLSLLIIWFWPLPQDASKCKVLCMKLYHCMSILVAISIMITMIYSLWKNLNNPHLIVESVFPVFPCIHVLWNNICHALVYQRLQFFTMELENFCKYLKPNEEETIQRKYIDKYAHFYGLSIISFYISVIGFIIGPFILHEPVPANADFPFDIYSQPIRTIIYIQQSIVCMQLAAHISLNAFMALLLWWTSAKFELLIKNFQTVTDTNDFIKCIEEHQKLLKYSGEVALTVSPFALGTLIVSIVTLIVIGLILIVGLNKPLKVRCFLVGCSALSEVFMYMWPAEHLIHTSNNVAQAIFNTDWYNKSYNFRRYMQLLILRSQKPVTVALPCGLPTLSLSCYASYLSTVFSYFTALRIIFEEQKN